MGAEKRPEKAHLDISHYRSLSREEIEKIERLANKIVLEDRPIRIGFMDRVEAERKYGVRIYQGGAVPAARLRIVDIDGWDAEACGGTHLTRTILVGPIKIIGTKKIHDGVIRVEFVAGEQALEYIAKNERYLRDACNILRVQPENLAKVVKRFFSEWKKQRDELSKLWKYLVNHIELLATKNVIKFRGSTYLLMRVDLDMGTLFEALRRLKDYAENILLVSTSMGENIFVCHGNSEFIKVVEEEARKLGGQIRVSKNRVFGQLASPADNLIARIKKRYGFS